jgi:tRNA A-37 threonylcarbamoyl transferase component Bud32
MIKTIPANNVNEFLLELAENYAKKNKLKIIERLPSLCSGVFKVTDESCFYVMKIIDSRIRKVKTKHEILNLNPFDVIKAISLESKIVNLIYDTPGIPDEVLYEGPNNPSKMILHKIKSYNNPLTIMRLTDYIYGQPLGTREGNACYLKNKITDNKHILENLIKKIHELGYANLDLVSPNIVLNNENIPYLVDFVSRETCYIKDVTKRKFERCKSTDISKIETFCKNYNFN